MRRRTRHDMMKLGAASAVLALGLGGLGYAALHSYGLRTADRFGCLDGVAQTHTLVLVDASEPRFNEEQARALRTSFDQLYTRLGFNEKLSFFTTERDVVSSIPRSRFHVCGQATQPEQLEAVGAAAGQVGFLKKQRERLYHTVLAPELDALLAIEPEENRRQLYQSPILEMIKDLSRVPQLASGSRLVVVSDLLQNSDTAQFCRTKGDMPRFARFAQSPVYEQRLKPESLAGVRVEVLMLQRLGYGHGALSYCQDEEELRHFWLDYFRANGATDVRFIRIRHGLAQG